MFYNIINFEAYVALLLLNAVLRFFIFFMYTKLYIFIVFYTIH